MSITKQIDSDGNVYSVEDRGDGTVIQLKADPSLAYTPPASPVTLGETVSIDFQLVDFDGELRHDNRDVLFIISGTEVTDSLIDGRVTLDIECLARGSISIFVAPVEITMTPLTIEVA